MKIVRLLNEGHHNIEERKRALQRKEATGAYKKNASYIKNPILEVLENLLSGKTEEELHKKDQGNQHNQSDQILSKLDSFRMGHQVKLDHPETNSNVFSQTSSLNIHRSSPNPIEQGKLEVASSIEDDNPLPHNRLELVIPERFFHSFNSAVTEPALRGKRINHYFDERLYNKAISKYKYHMQLIQGGYQLNSPKYSLSI